MEQVEIQTMRKVYATPEQRSVAWDWYADCLPVHRPNNLHLMNDGCTLTYDRVEGAPARDLDPVWRAASQMRMSGVVSTREAAQRRAIEYVKYVQSRLPESGVAHILWYRVAEIIFKGEFQRCWRPHGDLTAENVIVTPDNRIVFIDPGNPRGLDFAENDESKLMQSCDGWEVVRRDWKTAATWPEFCPSKLHWALLVTHYVRLLRHEHPLPSLRFALDRIRQISDALYLGREPRYAGTS